MDRLLELQIHEVEERHWWYRGRRRIIGELIQRLDLPRGVDILDAGCGSGRNMVELARLGTVTGLDLGDASVAWARMRGAGTVVHGSITEMPLAENSFDLAVCLDVIEHIDDEGRALRELRRVVRPDGILVLAVPAYQWLWSEHDVINHHKRRYTRRALAAVAADAGWYPVWDTYFNAFLLPAAVAHRRLSRLRHSVDEPVSDLQRTPKSLNSVLELPLRLEARVIASGRRIPAGLSLLMVLREDPGSSSGPLAGDPGLHERRSPGERLRRLWR
jgi:SAM-dependent methyltransferase